MTDEPAKKEHRPQSIPKSSIVDPFDVDTTSSKKQSDVNKSEKSTIQSEAKNALSDAISALSKKEQHATHKYNKLLTMLPILLVTGLLLFSVAFATSYRPAGNLLANAGGRFIEKTDELIEYSSLAISVGVDALADRITDMHIAPKNMHGARQVATPVAKERVKIATQTLSLTSVVEIARLQMAAVSGIIGSLWNR